MHGRISASSRGPAPGQGVGVGYKSIRAAHVADGATLDVINLRTRVSVQHAGRNKDVFANIAVISHAARDFDKTPKQDESVVGVLHLGSRFEADRTAPEELYVVGQRLRLQAMSRI